MAAPTFGAAGTIVTVTSATTINIPIPAGVVQNSVILVTLYCEGAARTATPPAGFTLKDTIVHTGTFVERIYWKRQTSATGAGETTGNYAFTLGAGAYGLGHSIRYEGVTTSGDPFDATSVVTPTTQATTTSDVNSLNTLGADRLLVHEGQHFDARTYTQPSGFTKDFGSTTGGGTGWGSKTQAAAGGTGNITNTWNASGKNTAWLGALIPASAPAGNTTAFFAMF